VRRRRSARPTAPTMRRHNQPAGVDRPRTSGRRSPRRASSSTGWAAGPRRSLVQSATSSRRAGTADTSARSSVSCPGKTRSRAAASNSANSASVCAEPRCSTRSTSRPRRVTIWTATAPDAVRTLRTNRETNREGFHAGVISDHHSTRETAAQSRAARSRSSQWHESGLALGQRRTLRPADGHAPRGYLAQALGGSRRSIHAVRNGSDRRPDG
jgi:hypothetical protein